MINWITIKRLIFIIIITGVQISLAQGKKALTPSAYDTWNHINSKKISPDGRWISYTHSPDEKDGILTLKSVTDTTHYSFSRGDSLNFIEGTAYSIFLVRPAKDIIEKAKEQKISDEKMPQDSLLIVNLDNGTPHFYPRIKNYKRAEEKSDFVAFQFVADTTKKDTSEIDKKSTEKNQGTLLTLLKLSDYSIQEFSNVLNYTLSNNGKYLLYSAASKDSSEDGLYIVRTESGEKTEIAKGIAKYSSLTINDKEIKLSYLYSTPVDSVTYSDYSIILWDIKSKTTLSTIDTKSKGLLKNSFISPHHTLNFSDNGSLLYFGTTLFDPNKSDNDDDLDSLAKKVNVDIWHWKDPYLQPMQLVNKKSDEKKSYDAVLNIKSGKIIQLATENIPKIIYSETKNTRYCLGKSIIPYRQEISWDYPEYYDYYFIDLSNGKTKKLINKLQWEANLSPSGKYAYWWDRNEKQWFVQSVSGTQPIRITENISVPLWDEDHDWAYKPDPYGSAGWTKNDNEFILYDRFDIWLIDPQKTKAPKNITQSYGRNNDLQFRYLDLDKENKYIAFENELLLSAFNLETKQGGYFSYNSKTDKLSQKPFGEYRFSKPQKAKNTDILLYTRESFTEFSDLWTSNLSFKSTQKQSDINPQQKDYLWGSAELISWTSLDGIDLQGLLLKPEDFDPNKKYPMIVYFYEKNSNNLYRHRAPKALRSIINFTYYTSNGYLIFIPDIPYKVGYPGESAVNAILPGITNLLQNPWVDNNNIGVQGHSWGGYQIAYLVTQTNIFKAAEAGAPVSNMFSAYGGIRWGTGKSRMFQYEKTQSRIGGSIWEYPMRYFENSPIFFADKITTPLLIMHNDKDGHVPWYQGIELFVALRRLHKPVWLVNYNGEPHWPLSFEKRKDWALRLQQYFDHYLKGQPAASWIENGIPATDKNKTLGYDPVE